MLPPNVSISAISSATSAAPPTRPQPAIATAIYALTRRSSPCAGAMAKRSASSTPAIPASATPSAKVAATMRLVSIPRPRASSGSCAAGRLRDSRQCEAGQRDQKCHDGQDDDAGPVGQQRCEADREEAAQSREVAMREIERADAVENEDEAERRQRVNRAQRQTVDNQS